jgi:hypothetical protein
MLNRMMPAMIPRMMIVVGSTFSLLVHWVSNLAVGNSGRFLEVGIVRDHANVGDRVWCVQGY